MMACVGGTIFAVALGLVFLLGHAASAHALPNPYTSGHQMAALDGADRAVMPDRALSAGVALSVAGQSGEFHKIEANRRMAVRADRRLPQRLDLILAAGSENAADSNTKFAARGPQELLHLRVARRDSVRAPPLLAL